MTVPPSLQWIFDPPPDSGAVQGGNPALNVFNPDLKALVREVLQNVNDQRPEGSTATIRVRFTFEQLTGPAKTEFLKAMCWGYLEPHLRAAEYNTLVASSHSLWDGLKAMETEPLVILRIDDMGTNGLTGGENDKGKNYNSLCRDTLISRDDGTRGGSYGLGKAVLWIFSSVRTVLFSSTINGDPQNGFRLFGRTELPYHQVEDREYNGSGYFGKPDPAKGGRRAVSVWDAEAAVVARGTHLTRTTDMGTGTSIMVVGFREPTREEPRPLPEVAQEIAELAVKWFWPVMLRGDLEVEVVASENGVVVYDTAAAVTNAASPFAAAVVSSPVAEGAPEACEVAEILLPFKVPGRKPQNGDSGTASVTAQFRLRVRSATNGESRELANKVALVRGHGMVVDYRTVRGVVSDRPFHAVLLAGKANGETEENLAAEAFLRASEPPAHDKWEASQRVRSQYKKGGGQELANLGPAIDSALSHLFEPKVTDDTPGPEALARLFQISTADGPGAKGSDGGPGRLVRKDEEAYLDEDLVWHFSGRVLHSAGAKKDWAVRMEIRLAEESGKGEPLTIASMQPDTGTAILAGATCTVRVKAGETEMSYQGTSAAATTSIDKRTAARTCLSLDVVLAPGGAA